MSNSVFKGDIKDNFEEDHYKGYRVYLHEEAHFWPNINLEKVGQRNLFIPPKQEKVIYD